MSPIMSRTGINTGVAVTLGSLTIASFLVVIIGCSDEPYVEFRPSDAYVQIGIGASLITLWLQTAAGIIAAVTLKKVGTAWLAALIWVAVALFFLFDNTTGYVEDILKFVMKRL